MEDDVVVCGICGSCNNVEQISLHIEENEDSILHDTAFVCINCFTKYENNMEIFIKIYGEELIEDEYDEELEI